MTMTGIVDKLLVQDELLTGSEVCKILRMSKSSLLRTLSNHADFPRPLRVGGATVRKPRMLFFKSEIEAYLTASRNGEGAPSAG